VILSVSVFTSTFNSGVADVTVAVTGNCIPINHVTVGVVTVNVILPVCPGVSVRFVNDGSDGVNVNPLPNVRTTFTPVAVLFHTLLYTAVQLAL
jgi:hypothetical protein